MSQFQKQLKQQEYLRPVLQECAEVKENKQVGLYLNTPRNYGAAEMLLLFLLYTICLIVCFYNKIYSLYNKKYRFILKIYILENISLYVVSRKLCVSGIDIFINYVLISICDFGITVQNDHIY